MLHTMISILIIGFICIDQGACLINAEKRLFKKLFMDDDYDPNTRPVLDSTKPVNVNFRYDIMQLFEVNEKSQTICILGVMYQHWYDPNLFWNSSEYDGLTKIVVPHDRIWTPDTTLYNTAEVYRPNTEDVQKASITIDPNANAGLVLYNYNTKHTIGCRFDMQYFPFDTQNCTFTFGSWSYDTRMLNYTLTSDTATMEEFQKNDAWSIASFRMVLQIFYYECCPYPYALVHAQLVIKRRPLYYIFNLVIPTIVINILSSFSLFASPGSPDNLHDKLQIGITTLLSYCILLLSVSDQIPKGSASVPLLGIFYVIVMIQNAVELFASVYLCYPNRRNRVMKLFKAKAKKAVTKVIPIKPSDITDQVQSKELQAYNQQSGSDYGMKPELVCLVISLASTFCIATVLFAIGCSA